MDPAEIRWLDGVSAWVRGLEAGEASEAGEANPFRAAGGPDLRADAWENGRAFALSLLDARAAA